MVQQRFAAHGDEALGLVPRVMPQPAATAAGLHDDLERLRGHAGSLKADRMRAQTQRIGSVAVGRYEPLEAGHIGSGAGGDPPSLQNAQLQRCIAGMCRAPAFWTVVILTGLSRNCNSGPAVVPGRRKQAESGWERLRAAGTAQENTACAGSGRGAGVSCTASMWERSARRADAEIASHCSRRKTVRLRCLEAISASGFM